MFIGWLLTMYVTISSVFDTVVVYSQVARWWAPEHQSSWSILIIDHRLVFVLIALELTNVTGS